MKQRAMKYGLERIATMSRGVTGGATDSVFQHSRNAAFKVDKELGGPSLAARIYASSPLVNTDQVRDQGESLADMIYLPPPPAPARKLTDKLQNWLATGDFA